MQRSKIRADIKFLNKWMGTVPSHPNYAKTGVLLKLYMGMARSDNPKWQKVGKRVLNNI